MNSKLNLYTIPMDGALSLTERKELFERIGGVNLVQPEWNERAKRWKSRFPSPELFEQRLRTESLTENQFNCFVSSLDLKIEAEAQRYYGDSDWVKVYSAAMSGYEQDALPGHNNHLGVAVYPFVVWACKEIRSFFAEMTIEVVQDDFIQDFAQGLTLDLMQFSQYSLILELNVAKLLNQLEGNDSKERFHSFVRTLSNKEMLLSFYSEYIVLARLLSIRTLYTVNNLKEAMNRFRDDMPELRSHFPFVNQAQLQKITLGIGDRHKKGNSVMCFHFTGGEFSYI